MDNPIKRFLKYAELWQRIAERPVDKKFFKANSNARARAQARASTWRLAANELKHEV